MKWFNRLIIGVMSLAAMSCAEDEVPERLNFFGDSEISRWGLQNSFPTLWTENYGNPGTGVVYLEECRGKSGNVPYVVLSGTNDAWTLHYSREFDAYAVRYVDAVLAIGSGPVYLFAILPRSVDDGCPHALHETIPELNRAILTELKRREEPRVTYIDLYDRFLGPHGGLDMNLSYDGLHYNRYGYEILTKALNDRIL